MKKIFFLFIFALFSILNAKNLNYLTAIKYKDFPKENFVRLVLFFVSPPPFFEIKKINDRQLKVILYNSDLTQYVPIVKVKSAILSEIAPKQVKSNVEVNFIFKRVIEDFSYIKSDVPSLIYIKVRVSESIEGSKAPPGNVTVRGNVNVKSEKIEKQVEKLKPKIKIKPKPKPKPKPKKIKIPKVEIDKARIIYEAGLIKMANNEYSEAISIFKQILNEFSKENPYYIKAQFRIADCYYKIMDIRDPHNIMNVAKMYFDLVTRYPKNPEASWAMFQMGNCYMKLGFYEEALAAYKYVIKYAPKTLYVQPATLNVGKIYYKFKKYDEAIKYFQQILKKYPNSLVAKEAYYKLGDCYASKKNYKIALKYYSYAEKNWPNLLNKMPETLYNIGNTYYHLKKPAKAREYFLKIRALFPKTVYVDIALLKIGETYLMEKNIPNALYVYNRVVQVAKDKNNKIIARLRMAEIGLKYKISDKLKYKYGYLVNPEKGFLYIIKKFPENRLSQIAYSMLVRYYLKIKDYHKAVFYLEEFFSKYPFSEISNLMKKNLKIALRGYINELFQNGEYFNILIYYEKYKEEYFSKIDDFNEFLQIALSMKNLFLINNSNKIFRKLLKKAKKRDKEFLLFNIIENDYYLNKNNILDEIDNFLEKYKNSKFRNRFLFLKAEILNNKKNFIYALQIYKNLKENHYNLFQITYKIAKIYEYMGDFKNANKYFNELISFSSPGNDLDSSIPDIYFQRGYSDFILKNFKRAIDELLQFTNKFSNDDRVPEAYFYVGESYFYLNNYEKAKENFNFVIKKFKNSFWAKSSQFFLSRINWVESTEKDFR